MTSGRFHGRGIRLKAALIRRFQTAASVLSHRLRIRQNRIRGFCLSEV
jgi:hypothetical protein